MPGELVTIFGGSGFVGRYVVRALCKKGYRVRIAVRNPGLAGDMRLAGDVGQAGAEGEGMDLRPARALVVRHRVQEMQRGAGILRHRPRDVAHSVGKPPQSTQQCLTPLF